MRLLLLSRQRRLYSIRRLREAAHAGGHSLRILDPLECTLALGGARSQERQRPRVLIHGREIRSVDCLIPRIGAALGGHGVEVVAHFEAMGVPVLNRARAIARARNKMEALQLLSQHGVDAPATVLAPGPAALDRALEIVGGPPVVLKLPRGAQGVGVILAETRAAAVATLDTLWALGQQVLIQEFVSESRGRDVRVLVVGGIVVAAMRRVAAAGEWRANLHRGGLAERIELDDRYARAATEAARAVGLDVAGVDILEGRNGPRVVEINASPGFEGLERATGVDIAAAILSQALNAPRPVGL